MMRLSNRRFYIIWNELLLLRWDKFMLCYCSLFSRIVSLKQSVCLDVANFQAVALTKGADHESLLRLDAIVYEHVEGLKFPHCVNRQRNLLSLSVACLLDSDNNRQQHAWWSEQTRRQTHNLNTRAVPQTLQRCTRLAGFPCTSAWRHRRSPARGYHSPSALPTFRSLGGRCATFGDTVQID